MSNRRRPGIYHHEGLVYPVPISISSNEGKVEMEEGFTFAIPDEQKKELALTFLECIKDTLTEEEYQRRKQRIEEEFGEDKSKDKGNVLKKIFNRNKS